MPNIKSAKKRVRVNATKAAANKARKSKLLSGLGRGLLFEGVNELVVLFDVGDLPPHELHGSAEALRHLWVPSIQLPNLCCAASSAVPHALNQR